MGKIIYALVALFILAVPLGYACGNNPNALVQGPFKSKDYDNGYICFQNTEGKRDIEFYMSFSRNDIEINKKIDTYYYDDAPAELMTVFFMPIQNRANVVVLLRWHVNYVGDDGKKRLYYYEVRTYKKEDDGYMKNLTPETDFNLSGEQLVENGKIIQFPLYNAKEIKLYLKRKYSE